MIKAAGVGKVLVILGQAAVAAEPERSVDDPPAREHDESQTVFLR